MDRAHTGAAHRQPLHSGASANPSLRPHAASTHIPHSSIAPLNTETPSRPDTEASAFPSRWRKAADGLRPPRMPRPEGPAEFRRSEHTGLNGPLLQGYSVAFRAPLHRCTAASPRPNAVFFPHTNPHAIFPSVAIRNPQRETVLKDFVPVSPFPLSFSLLRVTSRSLLRNFACRHFEVPNLFLQRRACGPASSHPAGNRYAWRTAALHSAPVAGKTVRSSQPLPFP